MQPKHPQNEGIGSCHKFAFKNISLCKFEFKNISLWKQQASDAHVVPFQQSHILTITPLIHPALEVPWDDFVLGDNVDDSAPSR